VESDWRRLRNEALRKSYASPHINRVIKPRRTRWVRHVTRRGEMRNAYGSLVAKSEGKRPLGASRRR
jgi:hypothetical protein